MNRSSFVFWILFLPLLDVWSHVDGATEVFSPAKTVRAGPGDTAVLPCLLDPRQDVTSFTVEWSRRDGRGGRGGRDGRGQPDYILIYRMGRQRRSGPTRTSLFLDRLDRGNISLAVFNVSAADSGTYSCAVPKLSVASASVELIVDPHFNHTSTLAPPPTSSGVTVSPGTPAGTDAGGYEPERRSFSPTAVVVTLFFIFIILAAVVPKCRQKSRKEKSQSFLEDSDGLNPAHDVPPKLNSRH